MLKESQLDELVAPMLIWKFKLGLFDDPYVDPDEAERIVGCDEHRKLALQAARETITLLKNDGGLAPLDAIKIKSIAVIGPNAGRCLHGGYSGVPKHNVSVLDGIKAKVGDRVNVVYTEGCKITAAAANGARTKSSPAIPDEDRRQIAEAVEVAKQADVIVLCIGGNELTSREAWNLQAHGRSHQPRPDRPPARARRCDARHRQAGHRLPVQRPAAFDQSLAQKVPVIFECWYLGQETGHAVADVLFGDYNPGGKLPITIPRSAGHLPAFYNYKPSARRGYLFDDVSPLYPFGFGLSYTTFSFGPPRLEKKKIRRTGRTRVLVDVTNTGQRARGRSRADVHPRQRQLRHAADQRAERLPASSAGAGRNEDRRPRNHARPLAFYDIDMKYVVEPGEFEIMVGNSSRDADLQKIRLTVEHRRVELIHRGGNTNSTTRRVPNGRNPRLNPKTFVHRKSRLQRRRRRRKLRLHDDDSVSGSTSTPK